MLLNRIRTIDKSRIIRNYGKMSRKKMEEADEAIRNSLGLEISQVRGAVTKLRKSTYFSHRTRSLVTETNIVTTPLSSICMVVTIANYIV